MANLPISGLTASASNLASTDLAPFVQTVGVGPVKMTGLQLAGGLLGSTTFNGSTVTTSSPVLNLTQTWNDGAVTFTGLRFNAAGSSDANSAAGSLLLDLQVGGTTIFNVSKASNAYTNTKNGGFAYLAGNSSGGLLGRSNNNGANGLFLGSGTQFGFTDGSGDTGNIDVILRRAAAATLQLGAADAAAPVAQTIKVQGVVAGTTNTAGANFTIQGSQGTGNAAGGSIIFQVAPAGGSGTAQNAYSTALTLNSAQQAVFAAGSKTSPAISFTGLNGGFYGRASGFISVSNGSVEVGLISGNGTAFLNSIGLATGAGSGGDLSVAGADVILARDAANTLALKNSTNAQIFRAYSTTTGPSYGYFASGVTDAGVATADTLFIGTGGAGAAMTKLALVVNGTTRLDYGVTNSGEWYTGSNFKVNGTSWGVTALLVGSSASAIKSSADGVIGVFNNAGTDFSRFQFGGSTSSFPALKRSTTTLQVRLADDSGDAAFQCGTATSGGTAFNVNGTGGNSIASVTNTTTGTLLQVLNSTSNPLMTVTDTTSGTLFSVQSTTAATLFSVNDTTSGTLLAVTNSSSTDVFTVADTAYVTINSGTSATQIRQTGGSATYPNLEFRNGAGNFYGDISVPNIYMIVAGSTTQGCAINSAGFQQRSDAAVSWGSSTTYASQDIYLARDATGPALALRNGTTAQTFRVYGSYTSSTVYDRLSLSSSSTAVTIAAETDTGDMDVVLTPAGTGNVKFGTHTGTVLSISGYIEIKDAGGTVRKLAVVS